MDIAEVARVVKEAFERISKCPASEREAMERAFANELKQKAPETAEMIRRARADGTILSTLLKIALKASLKRPDLSEDQKREAVADAARFVAALTTARESPHGHRSHDAALELAFEALMVGMNAGAPPEKIDEARALGRSDVGRSGARKSAERRNQGAQEWQGFASAEFERLRRRNPGIKASRAAPKIAKAWTDKFAPKKIGSVSVRKFLKKLEASW
jgi:hypothetical protein